MILVAFLHPLGKLPGTHDVRLALRRDLLHADRRGDRYGRPLSPPALCRNDHHAVGRPGAVDRCRRSVLQDCNRFDVFGGNVVERIANFIGRAGKREAVHHEKRLISRADRTDATHLNLRAATGNAAPLQHLYPGHLTGQRLIGPRHGHQRQVFRTDRRHRTRHILPPLRAIPHHDHLLQAQGRGLQGKIHLHRLSGTHHNRLRLVLIAHKGGP